VTGRGPTKEPVQWTIEDFEDTSPIQTNDTFWRSQELAVCRSSPRLYASALQGGSSRLEEVLLPAAVVFPACTPRSLSNGRQPKLFL
jgi:hypothetical protein